jgi:hypothetical protein
LRLWLRGFWLWKVHGSGWVLGILDFLGYEIVIGRIWVFLGFLEARKEEEDVIETDTLLIAIWWWDSIFCCLCNSIFYLFF